MQDMVLWLVAAFTFTTFELSFSFWSFHLVNVLLLLRSSCIACTVISSLCSSFACAHIVSAALHILIHLSSVNIVSVSSLSLSALSDVPQTILSLRGESQECQICKFCLACKALLGTDKKVLFAFGHG